MPRRPLNECAHCRYTWQPRGNDLSRRCPNCGTVFNDRSTSRVRRSSAPVIGCAALLLGGCVLFASCAGLGFLGSLNKDEAKKSPATSADKRDGPAPDKTAETNKAPTPKGPPEEPPADNAAPAPRRVTNRPPEGFSTTWVRVGGIETRVVGAAVRRPVLVDPKGSEFLAADKVLLVWVETQNAGKAGGELRRWIGSFEAAATLTGSSGDLAPVRFPGATVAGQLDRTVKLEPGKPGAIDVLVFTLPEDAARPLSLRLLGSHVGESGSFTHTIPADAWTK
ncbi:MAG TPA: hypothetical protein VGE74_28585 [Gemmata sp.]